eukprot:4913291-Amphidinium_carterae.1
MGKNFSTPYEKWGICIRYSCILPPLVVLKSSFSTLIQGCLLTSISMNWVHKAASVKHVELTRLSNCYSSQRVLSNQQPRSSRNNKGKQQDGRKEDLRHWHSN